MNFKTNIYMKIRLTESKLKQIVAESVKKVLKESGHLYGRYEDGTPFTNSKAKWHGVDGTVFISHGEWSDPEVWYDGEELNGNDLEDFVWEEYKIECEETGKSPSEQEFDKLPTQWFAEKIEDYMFGMFADQS